MKRFLLALLCLLPLLAFAQTATTTTIRLFPNFNGIDSNGESFGIIQNNLAVGKLTSFYFYEYNYETGVGYDYSHYIVGSIGSAGWSSTLNVVPAVVYDTAGLPQNGEMGAMHAQWTGSDNQGVYPYTAVPGQFAVDATFTAYTKCGGGSGRGGGYCHFNINWSSMVVSITE